jgi:hypothetical protein
MEFLHRKMSPLGKAPTRLKRSIYVFHVCCSPYTYYTYSFYIGLSYDISRGQLGCYDFLLPAAVAVVAVALVLFAATAGGAAPPLLPSVMFVVGPPRAPPPPAAAAGVAAATGVAATEVGEVAIVGGGAELGVAPGTAVVFCVLAPVAGVGVVVVVIVDDCCSPLPPANGGGGGGFQPRGPNFSHAPPAASPCGSLSGSCLKEKIYFCAIIKIFIELNYSCIFLNYFHFGRKLPLGLK